MSFSGSWSRGLLKASSGGVTILLEGRGYPAGWGLFAAGRGDDGHGGVRIGGFEVTSFCGKISKKNIKYTVTCCLKIEIRNINTGSP